MEHGTWNMEHESTSFYRGKDDTPRHGLVVRCEKEQKTVERHFFILGKDDVTTTDPNFAPHPSRSPMALPLARPPSSVARYCACIQCVSETDNRPKYGRTGRGSSLAFSCASNAPGNQISGPRVGMNKMNGGMNAKREREDESTRMIKKASSAVQC